MDSIKALKSQQAAAKAERLRISRDLRNACRRKRRLQKRARQLTDTDLLEVLRVRGGASNMVTEGEPTAAVASASSSNDVGDGDVTMD